MLHYALITDIYKIEDKVYIELTCDTAEDIRIETNILEDFDKYEKNKFYLIKTKNDVLRIRNKIDHAPFTKEQWNRVLEAFKTKKFYSKDENEWLVYLCAKRRYLMTNGNPKAIEAILDEFKQFFQL